MVGGGEGCRFVGGRRDEIREVRKVGGERGDMYA